MPVTLAELILGCLARDVRLMSVDQSARLTRRNHEAAERQLKQLENVGAVDRLVVHVRPSLPADVPLFEWRPGELPPHFGILAYRGKLRLVDAVRPTTVFVASLATLRLFGGKPSRGLKHPFQAGHDLQVTDIFLKLLESSPERAAKWILEDHLDRAKPGDKLPDAIIEENPPCVIDAISGYRPDQIEKIHEHCERYGLAYELW